VIRQQRSSTWQEDIILPDLADFQARFAAALLADTVDQGLATQPGFAVYRNTALSSAVAALAASYPRIEDLLGAEAFGAIALEYARNCRPDTPMLTGYGASFADYLADQPIGGELPYLADVARIDRMWTEVFFAADAAPLDAATFASFDLQAERARVVSLHPASRHAWFTSPAPAIWLAHQKNAFEPVEIPWAPGGIHITRFEDDVVVEAVPQADIVFLDLLDKGAPIVECAEQLLTQLPEADLAGIVARLLSRGALAGPGCLGPTLRCGPAKSSAI
jgi:hypothetical protein